MLIIVTLPTRLNDPPEDQWRWRWERTFRGQPWRTSPLMMYSWCTHDGPMGSGKCREIPPALKIKNAYFCCSSVCQSLCNYSDFRLWGHYSPKAGKILPPGNKNIKQRETHNDLTRWSEGWCCTGKAPYSHRAWGCLGQISQSQFPCVVSLFWGLVEIVMKRSRNLVLFLGSSLYNHSKTCC